MFKLGTKLNVLNMVVSLNYEINIYAYNTTIRGTIQKF